MRVHWHNGWTVLYVCTISPLSLSPKLRFFNRSGPPFIIRSVLFGWGCPGLQMADLPERPNASERMVDLSERVNVVRERERGDRSNTEYIIII